MKYKKYLIFSLILISLTLVLSGCISKNEPAGENVSNVNLNRQVNPIVPTKVSIDDLQAIKKLFVKKYNKPTEDVTLIIEQETEIFLRGIVKYGIGGPSVSGIFLATKQGGEWQISYDGQLPVPCDEVETFGFPSAMINDCK